MDSSSTAERCVGSNPTAVTASILHSMSVVTRVARSHSGLNTHFVKRWKQRQRARVVQWVEVKFHYREMPPRYHSFDSVCPSGLTGWTQVPLSRDAWVQPAPPRCQCFNLHCTSQIIGVAKSHSGLIAHFVKTRVWQCCRVVLGGGLKFHYRAMRGFKPHRCHSFYST